MADTNIPIKKFDTDNIEFAEPKVNQVGGKSVQVRRNGRRITLQLPWMRAPYGVNRARYGDPNSTDGQPSFQVSFKGMDAKDSIRIAHEKFIEFEDFIKNEGLQKNSMQWVKKKKISADLANEMYKSNIAQSRDENGEPDGRYPDTIKFKFPTNEAGQVTTLFFDSKDIDAKNFSQMGSDDVSKLTEHRGMKGFEVRLIVSLRSVWIGASNVGTSWVINQCIVRRPEGISNSYAYVPDDDDDDDKADDSDESEEEEEDDDSD